MPKTRRTIHSVVLGLAILLGMLACFAVSAAPASAQVVVGVSVAFGPPEIPLYDQPPCPGDDYIWTPGYWDWDGDEYFWVPGTWVLAPEPGFLWTPGFWGWNGTAFVFTVGYWGPVVGFYGGIDYGFGYFGHGFEGGRWEGDHFFYNRAVWNVNVNVIHNTYETRVVERNVTRVSYNGGRGGVEARPSAEEERAAHERHIGPIAAQTRHVQEARADRSLRVSQNHGRPPVAATEKPGEFRGNGVKPAREGGAVRIENNPRVENKAPREENRGANNPARANPAVHARDLPPAERAVPPHTGNSKLDQKYSQQQEKLAQQQARDRQKLQASQEREDQRNQRQNNEAARQQTEQRHQQQTQQMVQRHQQQSQQLERRQAPPPASHEQKKH